MKSITRRNLLIGAGSAVVLGAGAVVAVDQRILPGRSSMYKMLGLDGPAGEIPDVEAGPATSGTFVSAARLGATCGYTISYPPGSKPGDSLPVVVVLHGVGDDHDNAFGRSLGLDRFLAQSVADGTTPFAIASVDGGDTYWHKRASGEDSGAMITDEFLPLLADKGLDTSRISLFGWSMGGYGALLIGSRLGPDRVASIVADSPALWTRPADAAPIAFDDDANFTAHTVFGHESDLRDIPVRIDCGSGDGFSQNVQTYIDGLDPKPEGGIVAGGHNMAFWRRVAAEQLVFIGSHFG